MASDTEVTVPLSVADQIAEKVVDQAAANPDVTPTIAEQTQSLVVMFDRLVVRIMQPWSGYQILIVLGLILLSYCVYRFYRPRIRSWLGVPRGWPKWLLRILALINQRLWLLIFVLVSWALVIVMRELTWPSHSYFISQAAILSTGLFLIEVITRLIRNRPTRRTVKWFAWIYVTLEVVGLKDAAMHALDTISVDLGDSRLSAYMVLTAIVTLAVLFFLASFVIKFGTARINNIEEMSPSIRVLLAKALQLTMLTIAFLIGLNVIGFDVGKLALLSGAIGLGIGFGLQKIVSNLVSGVIILLDKSIKPGDVISLDGTFGWITQLGARYASVLTRDGREHLIPNEDFITSKVVNWSHTHEMVRLDINFGVAYHSDPHQVRRVAADSLGNIPRICKSPQPQCHMTNMGDSSIDFLLRFWIKDSTAGLTNVRGQAFLALWDALKENKIDIPFPRRDVQILPASETVNPLPRD